MKTSTAIMVGVGVIVVGGLVVLIVHLETELKAAQSNSGLGGILKTGLSILPAVLAFL